jgi:hypothetical protein
MLSVVMLNVDMLSVVMLCDIMLSVIMLSVLAHCQSIRLYKQIGAFLRELSPSLNNKILDKDGCV